MSGPSHPMTVIEALKAISDGFKVQNSHGDTYFRSEKTLDDAYDNNSSPFMVSVVYADCDYMFSVRKDSFAIHEIFDKYCKVDESLVGAGDKVVDTATGEEYFVVETAIAGNAAAHDFVIAKFVDITKPMKIIAYKQWHTDKINPVEITEDASKKPIKLKKVVTDGA